MRDNSSPCGSGSDPIYGGDGAALNEVKNIRLKVVASTAICNAACTDNTLTNSNGFYGGFEAVSYDPSTASYTDNNFLGGAGSTELSGSTSGAGSYLVTNNPYVSSSTFGRFAPHSGNAQLVVKGNTTAATKVWYKTITVQPGAVYNFSAWVSRVDATAPLIQLKANSTVLASLTPTAIDNWQQASGSFVVPAGIISVTFAIIDNDAAAGVNNYALDDICLVLASSPVTISGNVYDDANGLTDNTVFGTLVSAASTTLYANLFTSAGVFISSTTVTSGAYSFSSLAGNTTYKVAVSTVQGTAGATPASVLTGQWINTGEFTGTGAGNDGIPANGIQTVAVGETSVTDVRFGLERLPTSDDKSLLGQSNPGGTNRVQVPALTGLDGEDGAYAGGAKIIIKTLPNATTGGILYYAGTAVTTGQIIPSYDATLLTIDPVNGNVTPVFTYSHIDAAGKEDITPATVTMEFKVISLTGNVFDDANANIAKDAGEKFVSGTNVASGTVSVAAGANLYANLIDPAGKVIQSVQVAIDGTYTLSNTPINASGLKIQLSLNAGTEGGNMPATALPATSAQNTWINTGEVFAGNTASQATAGDGIINLTTLAAPISNQNFGIERLPFSDPKSSTQGNPGGTIKVTVPVLTGTDGEDGTYTGTSLTNTIVINTLPNATTGGILYYNLTPVTQGQVITSFDPSKLAIDPVDGNVTATFTYSHKDAGGKTDVTPATVTMDFKVVTISGNVFDDANNNVAKESGEKFVSGTNVASGAVSVAAGANLYVNLINASGLVIQTTQVAIDGTYSFSNVPQSTSGLKLQLTTVQGTVDGAQPATTLPATSAQNTWINTGEIFAGNTATQSAAGDGIINLTTLTGATITEQDFGIERLPTSDPKSSTQGNPGGTIKVTVPVLTGADGEDGTYNGTSLTNTIVINTLPNPTTGGILYYNLTPVTQGQVITSFDPSKLAIDPVDGTVTAVFTYSHKDAGGKTDVTPATVTMDFKVIAVSGNVFDDANANLVKETTEKFVSGTNVASGTVSVAAGANLYANLINASGTVVGTTQVAVDGTYSFANAPQSTTGLKIQLSTNQGTIDGAQPATALPANFVNIGETTGTGNTASQTSGLGIIDLTTGTTVVTNQVFAIEALPTPINNVLPAFINPGSTVNVTIPDNSFLKSDPDGTVASIRITGFPVYITSLRIKDTTYYANASYIPATCPSAQCKAFPTAGVVIPVTAAGLLTVPVTVDPLDGSLITYIPFMATDDAGKESPSSATVKVPFGLPDLTPTFQYRRTTLNLGQTTNAICNVTNIGDAGAIPANGIIVVTIAKPDPTSGYSISSDGVMTAITIFSSTPVDNTKWTFTEDADNLTFTLKTGNTIPEGTFLKLGFVVTRTATGPTANAYSVTATIRGGGGGETNLGNNFVGNTITSGN